MVPLLTKVMFAMGAVTLVASAAYGVATNDGSATLALGSAAVGALALGVAVMLADPDRAPWYAPDAALAQQPPAGTRPAPPSPWPLAAALALGVAALAMATDALIVITAVILAAGAGLGWFFQHWSEHPTYGGSYAARLKERLLIPIGLPVGVFCLVAVIAISLSRVFLALSENGTRLVALLVAVLILVSAFVVAASSRMARTALALLCIFAFLCLVGAGVAGLAHGERSFEKPKPIPHAPLPPGVNPGLAASLHATSAKPGSGTGGGSPAGGAAPPAPARTNP